MSPRRRPERRCTTRRSDSRPSATGTSSTSSPTPSARPTGAATTTSRSRSSARWHWSDTPFRRGSSSGPEPAERARRSAATRASGGTRRGCASSTRRTRSSTRAWTGDPSTFTGRPSRIEGIGRQRVEPSFLPDIVDRMIQVPDAASIATMRLVRDAHGTQRRRLDRDERLGSAPARRRDAGAWGARQRRHPDLRRRRALRRHLLQRRVGRAIRASSSRRTQRRWRPSSRVARSRSCPSQRPKRR